MSGIGLEGKIAELGDVSNFGRDKIVDCLSSEPSPWAFANIAVTNWTL
ncbi:hypothetical protein NKH80_29630 [Mesorhizobium sp. M0904]